MLFKILIVDDDTNLLSVLKNIFADEGYEVEVCSNGLEAIQRYQEQPFDLVITDIMMPGASGLDVLKSLRELSPTVLVILITGFASLETAIKAIRDGAYDYITKPFKLEEIKIVVKNAFDRVRLVRENHKLLHKLQEAYKQLDLVEKITQIQNDKDEKEADRTGDVLGKTLIAGTMLPYHFMASDVNKRESFVLNLERVSRLREKGHISQGEFELCKARLFQSLK